MASEKKKEMTPKVVKLVQVERVGDKLILPKDLTYDQAIEVLAEKRDSEEQVVSYLHQFKEGVPYDYARAFYDVCEEHFGVVARKAVLSWFGPIPPKTISVQTGVGEVTDIPLGKMELPGVTDGVVTTGIDNDGYFYVRADIMQKYTPLFNELISKTKEWIYSHSIYRGKAFKISLSEVVDGEEYDLNMPGITFFSPYSKAEDLIFSQTIQDRITASIWTPIEKTDACREAKIPLKRGVLLSGPFGLGKTLTARVTAHKAQENGWTFLLVSEARDFARALEFARFYAPCVIFCEDIDRVTSGDRTAKLDNLLNTLDGIESKASEIMVVLTTNDLGKINKAFLRPGRLDDIIELKAPDAEAAQRLIRVYGGDLIDPEEDLSSAGKALDGCIPAFIRECVDRAKLWTIALDGEAGKITDAALTRAALSMKEHIAIFEPKDEINLSDREKAAAIIATALQNSPGESVARAIASTEA